MTNTNINKEIYTCLAVDFDNKLKKRIESIGRQIEKYGCGKVSFEELSREVVELPVMKIDHITSTIFDTGIRVPEEVVHYTFEMPNFKVGNYYPVALIEHDVVANDPGCTNFVKYFDSRYFDEVPQDKKDEWKTIKGHCDDCNDKYLRVRTVMLRDEDDGSYRQIGMSCLKRYLGISAYNVINNFRTVSQLVVDEPYIDEDSFPGGRVTASYVKTVDYVASAIRQINIDGGYEKEGKTAQKAFNYLLSDGPIDISNYINEAEEIVQYFRNIPDNNDLYDDAFTRDTKVAISQDYTKVSGLIAYASLLYMRLKDKEEKHSAAVKNSDYVGEKCERISGIKAKVISSNSFESRYGVSYVNTFEDLETHNQFVWFTSTATYSSGIIGEITRATVKDHQEYNGIKQTVLTRVKFVISEE